ncbi:uncharacterized protein K02A2.6-like [Ornithodoros turicata]|uniref:uncharacterized protein K02A2.6-like n=1 Tax=Ornithodoros turicata TaxID=34597 RepID=UPI00313A1B30
MLRWTLTLGAYSYELRYRKGEDMDNADALSRLPLEVEPGATAEPNPPEVFLIEEVPQAAIHARNVAAATDRDQQVLLRVQQWTRDGWLKSSPQARDLKPYWTRRFEISIQDCCLLWGTRVIVPQALRQGILTTLHSGHAGIVRTKAMARSFVWWPGIDADIESMIGRCTPCQLTRNMPSRDASHPWLPPQKPWSRLHLDYAGPFQGRTFLMFVDTFSRWPEVIPVSSMSAAELIRHLRRVFATHGLPDVVFTDNGTSFTSSETADFLRRNSIRHMFSPPYHPQSNGVAERMVQNVKKQASPTTTRRSGLSSITSVVRITYNTMLGQHKISGATAHEP